MSISAVGTAATPTASTTGDPVSSAWGTGQTRSAGNLLIAVLAGFGSTSAGPSSQFTGTSGWTKQREGNSTHNVAAIWTKPATGGDAAPQFVTNVAGTHQAVTCALYELHDSAGSVPVVDTGGAGTGGTTSPLTVTTAANVAAAGEYALGVQANGNTIASQTITWNPPGGGWTNAFTPEPSSHFGHFVVATQAGPASGGTLSYAPPWSYSSNAPTDQAGAVLVIAPGIPPANGDMFLVF